MTYQKATEIVDECLWNRANGKECNYYALALALLREYREKDESERI